MLCFLVLRWTGFRGSDAVALSLREVHFGAKEIERLTRKRKKKVVLPVHPELLFAIEAEGARRNAEPGDHVLVNPVPVSHSRVPVSIRG